MLIRNIFDGVASDIERIHDGSFPFPDLSNRLMISKKFAIDRGHLVGAAMTRVTAEGILIMNKEMPIITRARAAEQLIITLRAEAKEAGLEDCHVFVKDPKVHKFLEHIGFQDCQGGQPMVIYL